MNDWKNTTFGWVLASGIVALGGAVGSGMYFHGDNPQLHEGEQPGYLIEAPEEGAAVEDGPGIIERLNLGSAEEGAAVFARCQSCHNVSPGGASGLGPALYGVVGQPIGSHASDFAYSSALTSHGGTWDWEALDQWLASPKGFIPGNQMSFPGISNGQDRANVILYLLENGGGPSVPPFVPDAEPAEGEEGDAIDAPAPDQPGEEAGAVATDDPVASSNTATDNS